MTDFSYQLYSSREMPLAKTLPMLRKAGYTAVEGYGGEGLVGRKHHPNGAHDLAHLRIVQGAGLEQRRETGGSQPRVAIAQRHR